MMLMLLVALLTPPVAAQAPAAAERRLMLTRFDRVRVDGAFTVLVASNPSIAGRIVGDPRMLEAVTVRVEGSTLIVSPTRGDGMRPVTGSAPLPVVEVASDRITGVRVLGGGTVRVERMIGTRVDLSLAGAGAIAVDAMDADYVSATLIGSGTINAAGRGGQGRFLLNGPGTIDAARLTTDDLTVRSEGAGTGRYRARYTADVTASGAGSVRVEGAPRCRTRGTAAITCGD
jgi:hypothetical protein